MTRTEEIAIKEFHRGKPNAPPAFYLSRAVMKGWCELAALSIRAGADVNRIDAHGLTPLQRYLRSHRRHDKKFVLLLLEAGAEANRPGVVTFASPEILQLLMRAGAAVDGTSDADVPLIDAIMMHVKPDYPIALIEAGANVNQQNHAFLTPLLAACLKGSRLLVDRLLQAGASSQVTDIGGRSPLRIACEAMTRVPRRGWGSRQRSNARSIVLMLRDSLPAQPEDPLLATLVLDDAEDLERRLKIGLDANEQVLGPYGDQQAIDRLESFLKKTTEWARLDKLPVATIPILCFAAAAGSRNCVGLLLKHGADPARPDTFGHSPAAYAEGSGQHDIASLLRGKTA